MWIKYSGQMTPQKLEQCIKKKNKLKKIKVFLQCTIVVTTIMQKNF